MRLLNNALSNLKAYARREYYLTDNGSVLVMLITEEEHRTLKDYYDNIVKANTENVAEEENVTHCSEEFFPNVASTFELVQNYSPEVRPIVTPILREAFDIPHFGNINTLLLFERRNCLNGVAKWIFRLMVCKLRVTIES